MKITAVAQNGWVELTFDYDRYLIAICKALGGRFGGGRWIIHRDKFQALVGRVGADMIICGPELQKEMPAPIIQRKSWPIVPDFSPLRPTWSQQQTAQDGKPRSDYQAEGASFIYDNENALLMDDMGLGKSSQVINAISHYFIHDRPYRLNVSVTTKALNVNNFAEEIRKFSIPHTLTILRGPPAQRRRLLQKIPEVYPHYILTGWQMMRICIEELAAYPFDWVVLDECHLAKSTPLNGNQSAQAQAIHRLQAPRKTAMTGTFIINGMPDPYNILKWLGVEQREWYQFERDVLRVVKYKPSQYANLELKMVVGTQPGAMAQMQEKIASCSLRRTRDDVMDLPPYIRTDVEVFLSEEETNYYLTAEESMFLKVKGQLTKIELMSIVLRLKQITSSLQPFLDRQYTSAKLGMMAEYVSDLIDGGQKVMVCSQFRSPGDSAVRILKQFNPAQVHGELSMAQRDAEVTRFQLDPKCGVIVLSSPACREGINLTAASAIIHIDKEWSQAYVDQLEGRARRIGSEKHRGINVYSLLARLSTGQKTVDYGIEALLEKKGRVAAQLVGM